MSCEPLHDLLWVRADQLHLGDLIEGSTTRKYVEALELHGDDVLINYGDITTSVGNVLRVRRAPTKVVDPRRAQA